MASAFLAEVLISALEIAKVNFIFPTLARFKKYVLSNEIDILKGEVSCEVLV